MHKHTGVEDSEEVPIFIDGHARESLNSFSQSVSDLSAWVQQDDRFPITRYMTDKEGNQSE